MPGLDITKLFQLLPPPQLIPYLQNEILSEFKDVNSFIEKYGNEIISRVRIEGRGFKPVAVMLGGAMSIAGLVVAIVVFRGTLKYIITSPEVEKGNPPPFKLSHEFFRTTVEQLGLEPVIVPFNDIPSGGIAEKLLEIMKEGSIIVQGVSAELALWLGRNAGVGRLLVYRPENGFGVFKFV